MTAVMNLAEPDEQSTLMLLEEELAATNREVMALTLELEQRVADRTEELSHAVATLRAEVLERTRAETEVRRLNEDLVRRAEQLEIANHELEAFSGSVSHDLRNPLARIIGFAAVLEETLGASLSGDSRHHLKHISQAGQKMSALIDDLLRLSRCAHCSMAVGAVALNEMTDLAISEVKLSAPDRNVLWKRGELPEVAGDRGLLHLALTNLLSNALKYTRPRPCAEIEIGVSADTADEWTLFVRDNGVGFDATGAQKLFRAFQRLHDASQFEGTGIGLVNVRRIISRHGGRVWAEGAPDAGATFYFTLPKRPRN